MNPGAGVTSTEFKFQQSDSADPAGLWFSYPIDDISTITTSADSPPEFYISPRAWTQSFPSTAGVAQLLGPFEVTAGKNYARVAYKITGVGSAVVRIEATTVIM